jgi:hypothetical protein
MDIHDIDRLVRDKVEELAQAPTMDVWAAHAVLCAQEFVRAAPAWQRWPDTTPKVLEGFTAALSRYVASGDAPPIRESVIVALEAFDQEDDGTVEWQFALDTISMLLDVLNGEPALTCLRNALTTYLEGTFHAIANAAAGSLGRPVSQVEALALVDKDPEWRAATELVLAL